VIFCIFYPVAGVDCSYKRKYFKFCCRFMKIWIKKLMLYLTFSLTLSAYGQTRKAFNFFTEIKRYDLSGLWRSDSIYIEGGPDRTTFPEPLGYIGENYQRFYIHYLTVERSKYNPYIYIISGKTKVKDNICRFNGAITVSKAMLYGASDDSRFEQGLIVSDVLFFEDSAQASSGIIKGRLTTKFYLDSKGKIHYDALMYVSDRFFNNQCEAIWTSYKTGKSKKCNWGDFRIPESEELDQGAGDVSIVNKYVKSGWESYVAAYSGDEAAAKKARRIEDTAWWK
jgi:hypothetical protein